MLQVTCCLLMALIDGCIQVGCVVCPEVEVVKSYQPGRCSRAGCESGSAHILGNMDRSIMQPIGGASSHCSGIANHSVCVLHILLSAVWWRGPCILSKEVQSMQGCCGRDMQACLLTCSGNAYM